MGKLRVFAVNFDGNNTVYYSGNTITGSVIVDVEEEMKMKEIRLEIIGAASVHWTETRSSGSGKYRTTTTVHYSSSEVYFNSCVILRKDRPDSFVLPVGCYLFPFQFALPPGIPCSYESPIGRVRYSVNAIIDRPWRFNNNVSRPFTVITHLDLNREPNITIPMQATNQKTLCCLCCKSGPIHASLRLDRTGFVPGEYIPIHAECLNQSNRRMVATRASLVQSVAYHATTKTRRDACELVRVERPAVLPGDSDAWRGEGLPVPPCAPSDLRGCNIIEIKYFIKFTVVPSGPALDLHAMIPITIGTIPLMQMFNTFAQDAPSMSTPFHADYPMLSPPSYEAFQSEQAEQRVDGAPQGDGQQSADDVAFTPSYAVYKRSESSAPQSGAKMPTDRA